MENEKIMNKIKNDHVTYVNSNCVYFNNDSSNCVLEEVYSDLDFKKIIELRKLNMAFLSGKISSTKKNVRVRK